jgi:hypothetical protein
VEKVIRKGELFTKEAMHRLLEKEKPSVLLLASCTEQEIILVASLKLVLSAISGMTRWDLPEHACASIKA